MLSMNAARLASNTSARAAMSALCSSMAARNASVRAFTYSSSAHGADVSRHSISAGSSVSACDGPMGTWSPHRCLAASIAPASGSISAASRAASSLLRSASARAAVTLACSASASRSAAFHRCSAVSQAVRSSRRASDQFRQFLPRRTPPASATDSAPRDRIASTPCGVTVVMAGRPRSCAPSAASVVRYSSSAAAARSLAGGTRASSSATPACADSTRPYASSQACSS